MNIGLTMKRIRENHAMSQRMMAHMLGITATALWKIENGKSNPKMSTVEKFCKKLEIPLALIMVESIEPSDFPFEWESTHDIEDVMDILSFASQRIKKAIDRR